MGPLTFGLVLQAGLNDQYSPKNPPSTADRIPPRSIPHRTSCPAYPTSVRQQREKLAELTSCRYHLDLTRQHSIRAITVGITYIPFWIA